MGISVTKRLLASFSVIAKLGRIASKHKWMQDAVKHEGRVRKHFGIHEGETLPMARLTSEIARLHKKSEKGKLTQSESSLLNALNLAKTFKKKD